MEEDVDAWRLSFSVLLFISIAVFFVQRFVTMIFVPVFEVCVFYFPTMILLFILLKQRSRQNASD